MSTDKNFPLHVTINCPQDSAANNPKPFSGMKEQHLQFILEPVLWHCEPFSSLVFAQITFNLGNLPEHYVVHNLHFTGHIYDRSQNAFHFMVLCEPKHSGGIQSFVICKTWMIITGQ